MTNLPDHIIEQISCGINEITASITYAAENINAALVQPHVLMRPKLFLDGDKWCALYGDDLQNGLAGFGSSPARAMSEFNRAWSSITIKAE